jgi:putative acetyltransferase
MKPKTLTGSIMVRDYKQSDLEEVVALFGSSVRGMACHDYSSDQISAWAPATPDLSAWAKRLSTGAVFVYERENRIVGFTRIELDGNLDLLYVHPRFQRQGIAQALFERVLAWAANKGVRHLTSEVSITARPFFEHAGFRMVGPQTIELRGVLIQNFCMEREIDA